MAKLTLEEKHRNAQLRQEIAMMKLDEARVAQTLKIMEEIPEFAQDEDEKDWIVSGSSESKEVYTQAELDTILTQARKLQYKPAGRNILQTLQDFIIGKSASIQPADENPKTIDYWKKWQEANNFDLKSKEIIKRLFRDGNDILRWFKKNNQMVFRFIDPAEIKAGTSAKPTFGIETDPDDYEKIISYHREYKDSNNNQKSEDIPAEEVDHWKIMVDSDVKMGVSFFQGLGKYIVEYEKWLEGRINLNKIRQIWNIVAEPVAGTTTISDIKSKFGDTIKDAVTGSDKKKKVPSPGSILISKGMKWDLKSLNINASDTADDGRAIQLMIAIGTNFPEYIIRADASNANFASTMVSESPFVRAMESWQDFCEKIFKKIFKRVIEAGIESGEIPKTFKAKVTTFNPDTQEDVERDEERESSTDCIVNFATLIHHDMKADTEAVQIHTGEKWCSKKTASEKFDYDYQEEQEQIAREAAEEEKEMKRKAELYGMPNMDAYNQPGVVPGENNNNQSQE